MYVPKESGIDCKTGGSLPATEIPYGAVPTRSPRCSGCSLRWRYPSGDVLDTDLPPFERTAVGRLPMPAAVSRFRTRRYMSRIPDEDSSIVVYIIC